MIEITKDSNVIGDTSVELLRQSTINHIDDVRNGLLYFRERLLDAAEDHDKTKIANMGIFHDALSSGRVKDSHWYRMHIKDERHHLLSRAPDDVNLIDVLEYVTDCVMAGMSRSGDIYEVDLPGELLHTAIKNTAEMLKEQVTVKEDD